MPRGSLPSRMTETVFRLFLSSPGDVAAERRRVDSAVEKLNAEFKDRSRFETIQWEKSFYSAHETFQRQIPEAADYDLVVAVFRGRIGSPLPPDFRRLPDGSPYPSGSAYEVLSAMAKRHTGAALPDIYVFRYPRPPQVSVDEPSRHEIETNGGGSRASSNNGSGLQAARSSRHFNLTPIRTNLLGRSRNASGSGSPNMGLRRLRDGIEAVLARPFRALPRSEPTASAYFSAAAS
jgi:hypothetical protein